MTCKCPSCGDEFKNEMGVRSHHSQKHGGPGIPVDKVVVDCDYCGSDIKKYPSVAKESDLHFCNGDCHSSWKSECRPKEEHNWYSGGPVTVECSNCSTEIERKPSIAEINQRFYCNTKCEAEWKSENQGAYRWDNEKTHYSAKYYGSNWPKQRKKRLEVDEYSCVACGISNEEHKKEQGRALSVHHIKDIDHFRDEETNNLDEKEANKVSNLLTMCRPCHKQWENEDIQLVNRAISHLTSAGALAVSELETER